jgi:hypothetical protein
MNQRTSLHASSDSELILLALALLLTLFSISAIAANTQTPKVFGVMLAIKTEDLNGRAINLPADLPAERTLVLAGFSEEHQKPIGTWIDGMKLRETTAIGWMELPVVGRQNGFVRSMITSSMKKGRPKPAERGRTAVVFVKAEDFLKPLGLPQNDRNIFAMVINRRGEMLNYAVGEYSDEKAKALLPFLKND